jgi:tubulin polyglutamylase TTLL4
LESAFHNHRLWIVKPCAAVQGKGIHLIGSETCEIPNEESAVQVYVEHPLLITGRKFDVRLYIIVTSVCPIRICMHDSGLIRFATHQYDPHADLSDVQTHLTNFSLNKTDELFVRRADDAE